MSFRHKYANVLYVGVVEVMVTRTGSGDGGQVLRFRNQNYSTTLEEHAAINTRVITVELENPPAEVTYSIASGNVAQALYINNNGKLLSRAMRKCVLCHM